MTTSAPESTIDLIGAILIEMFEFPAEEVQGGTLMRDMLTDSLMVVEMAIVLHERLGIKVDEEELRALTLAEFAEVLDARRTAG
ncbi:phosphopantetheine-binding protein [Streptomyces sp. ZAF1911]|uniref:acyl carrier protein n=1 Tax=Streptomyces sp. ZAF1911 TaxID=2944129 RepID=UPI00237B0626|nr:phosphopantetheine-binding protein [Streptomyces sp. ZAF1911]MDD9375374.1 phosphopantetheine-binding protein [Streptomyces sp. ZAF1911]